MRNKNVNKQQNQQSCQNAVISSSFFGVPLSSTYWINEIHDTLYISKIPKREKLSLIKYYRRELKESRSYEQGLQNCL